MWSEGVVMGEGVPRERYRKMVGGVRGTVGSTSDFSEGRKQRKPGVEVVLHDRLVDKPSRVYSSRTRRRRGYTLQRWRTHSL